MAWIGTPSFSRSGGVFLEGLEAVFIVLTFGANAAAEGTGNIQIAGLGAAVAVVLVTIVGAIVHQPLSLVPENAPKFVVGAMLTAFGTFWASEGVGVVWPGHDAAIVRVGGTFSAATRQVPAPSCGFTMRIRMPGRPSEATLARTVHQLTRG